MAVEPFKFGLPVRRSGSAPYPAGCMRGLFPACWRRAAGFRVECALANRLYSCPGGGTFLGHAPPCPKQHERLLPCFDFFSCTAVGYWGLRAGSASTAVGWLALLVPSEANTLQVDLERLPTGNVVSCCHIQQNGIGGEGDHDIWSEEFGSSGAGGGCEP